MKYSAKVPMMDKKAMKICYFHSYGELRSRKRRTIKQNWFGEIFINELLKNAYKTFSR